MVKANCGGLVLDNSTLKMSGNIIIVAGDTPTSAIKANCGGVQFDSAAFKKVGKTITDINADVSSVSPMVVAQAGCGGLLVDSNYFEINNSGELVLKSTPIREIDKFKISFIDQDTSELIDLSDGWTLSAGTITLAKGATTKWSADFEDGTIGDDGRVDFAVTAGINLESDMILTLANATATKGSQTASAGASVDLDYDDMVDIYYSGVIEPEVEVTIA